MPEQSQASAGPLPGAEIPQEDQKATVGSTQSGEEAPVPQAQEEVQKPVEQPAAPAKENQSEEDPTKYREVQSLKDQVASLKETVKQQQELTKEYVPSDVLEGQEKEELAKEKAKLQQEKAALERAKVLDSLFKEPEYQDLEPFRGDIKGSTEEEIRKELNERRTIVESWKARAGKGGTGNLPSVQSAKGSVDVSADAAKKMTATELENVLPKR
jgi:hypothetical protein